MSQNMNETSLNLVNTSGFPLQIGILNAIKKTKKNHGWDILSSEHPWLNRDTGEDGFIDLILEDQYKVQVMLLECKRVKDAEWIFLIPSKQKKNINSARSWITINGISRGLHIGWYDFFHRPISEESEFCVIRGGDKDKPMLERIAAKMTDAIESFAEEELNFDKPEPSIMDLRVYYSVIVTTAQIKVCRFNPNDIIIAEGDLTPENWSSF